MEEISLGTEDEHVDYGTAVEEEQQQPARHVFDDDDPPPRKRRRGRSGLYPPKQMAIWKLTFIPCRIGPSDPPNAVSRRAGFQSKVNQSQS